MSKLIEKTSLTKDTIDCNGAYWMSPVPSPQVVYPDDRFCPDILITTDISPTTVSEGEQATFTVVAETTGTSPMIYKWYKGGALVPGAITSVYTFTTVLEDNGKSVYVDVSNNCDSVRSSSVLLTVDAVITDTWALHSTDVIVDRGYTDHNWSGGGDVYSAIDPFAVAATNAWPETGVVDIIRFQNYRVWFSGVDLDTDTILDDDFGGLAKFADAPGMDGQRATGYREYSKQIGANRFLYLSDYDDNVPGNYNDRISVVDITGDISAAVINAVAQLSINDAINTIVNPTPAYTTDWIQCNVAVLDVSTYIIICQEVDNERIWAVGVTFNGTDTLTAVDAVLILDEQGMIDNNYQEYYNSPKITEVNGEVAIAQWAYETYNYEVKFPTVKAVAIKFDGVSLDVGPVAIVEDGTNGLSPWWNINGGDTHELNKVTENTAVSVVLTTEEAKGRPETNAAFTTVITVDTETLTLTLGTPIFLPGISGNKDFPGHFYDGMVIGAFKDAELIFIGMKIGDSTWNVDNSYRPPSIPFGSTQSRDWYGSYPSFADLPPAEGEWSNSIYIINDPDDPDYGKAFVRTRGLQI